ncbi:MAG: hypothetical protein V8R51_00350 [Clostridia bacterium]|jgi:response regulator receiver domain
MGKIRTLIAHNDENVTNNIINTMKNLDYVEVVGTANNGKETYNKIVDLKPEVVFAKIDMEHMSSMEIIKKSKEDLKDNIPVFNFITTENVSDEYMKEAYNIIGRNLNSFVTEPVNHREIDNIMENYKQFKENQ